MFNSLLQKYFIVIFSILVLSGCAGSTTDTTSNNNALGDLNTNYNPDNTSNNDSVSYNGVATIQWLPPTENTDGTSLTDLSGYKIYYGTSSNALSNTINISNISITEYVIPNLVDNADYYFSITAINSNGVESNRSNIIYKRTVSI